MRSLFAPCLVILLLLASASGEKAEDSYDSAAAEKRDAAEGVPVGENLEGMARGAGSRRGQAGEGNQWSTVQHQEGMSGRSFLGRQGNDQFAFKA
eukprot:2006043-Rhodomonas_salina.3